MQEYMISIFGEAWKNSKLGVRFYRAPSAYLKKKSQD